MTLDSGRRLDDVLARATRMVARAIEDLERTNRELLPLCEIQSNRAWTAEEFARYLELSRHECNAHHRYRAGRQWFDNARRVLGAEPSGARSQEAMRNEKAHDRGD
jgi:hypothetical protein